MRLDTLIAAVVVALHETVSLFLGLGRPASDIARQPLGRLTGGHVPCRATHLATQLHRYTALRLRVRLRIGGSGRARGRISPVRTGFDGPDTECTLVRAPKDGQRQRQTCHGRACAASFCVTQRADAARNTPSARRRFPGLREAACLASEGLLHPRSTGRHGAASTIQDLGIELPPAPGAVAPNCSVLRLAVCLTALIGRSANQHHAACAFTPVVVAITNGPLSLHCPKPSGHGVYDIEACTH